MGASTMLNRVSTLVNVGYAEKLESGCTNSEICVKPNPRSGYTNRETWVKPNLRSSFTDPRNTIQEEYINEEVGILNTKGGNYSSNLYENNEEFRDEIINFIRDKKIRP